MCEIEVAPAPGGWTVCVHGEARPVAFLGGRAAEQAARRLAQRVSAAGRPVRLTIRLRDGSIAGRLRYPASVTAPAEVSLPEAA